MTANDAAILVGAICSGVSVLTTAYISWRTAKHAEQLKKMEVTQSTILKDVNNNTTKATAEIAALNVKITEMTKVAADKDAAHVAADLRVALATIPPPPVAVDMTVENMTVENFDTEKKDMSIKDDSLDVAPAPEKPKHPRSKR